MRVQVGLWGGAAATVALVAALVVGVAGPANACGCGALASPAATPSANPAVTSPVVTSPAVRAIIGWDGTTETIDLSVTVSATGGKIGIVLPTPTAATVSTGNANRFAQLDAVIAPRVREQDDWWGRRDPRVVAEAGAPTGTITKIAPRAITATDKSRLASWLAANKLTLSDAAVDGIREYADANWSLSLIALTVPAGPSRELAPIRLSFRTATPVMSLRLAATDATPFTMRVYALSSKRSELRLASKAGTAANAAPVVAWAGPLAGTVAAGIGTYLTVTDLDFGSPLTQVTDDLAVRDSARAADVIPTVVHYRPIRLLGLPLGWLLSGWAGLGLLVGLGYLGNRFRAK